MNWRLFALGLIISVASHLNGGWIGHWLTLRTDAKNWEQVEPTLIESIKKATNEITNEIKIDKIKKSDSIRIVMDPENRQRLVLQKGCGKDSICIPTKDLSNKQKRKYGVKN